MGSQNGFDNRHIVGCIPGSPPQRGPEISGGRGNHPWGPGVLWPASALIAGNKSTQLRSFSGDLMELFLTFGKTGDVAFVCSRAATALLSPQVLLPEAIQSLIQRTCGFHTLNQHVRHSTCRVRRF